jgi:hypothetical protein
MNNPIPNEENIKRLMRDVNETLTQFETTNTEITLREVGRNIEPTIA